ncbi:MAG: hypothetical protein GF409_00875 [Candidatus Omnitrophica bacterium]|nr:hypothetical protein [Candidatus Omnitrophota bacterium]
MKVLYDIFFIFFALFYLPVLLFKGRLHGEFLQKFGLLPEGLARLDRPVWIHAVSVGEAVIASKLARRIKARWPQVPVIVSTTTQTGNNMIRKAGKGCVDGVFYYPLDLSFVVSRVVKALSPRLYVMVETELWPNLLKRLHSEGVPVALINGRISDSSYGNYRKIKFVTKRVLPCVDTFCVQTQRDAERLSDMGAERKRIHVTGNMKFDDEERLGQTRIISKEYLGFGPESEIIVAGSTHFPEEQKVIDIFRDLNGRDRSIKLILAPRHVERIDAIRIYTEKRGLAYRKLSDLLEPDAGAHTEGYDVLLVDLIGYLKDLYSLASVVFVGGSFAKHGGQNPIEPARWGKAVIYGPHMFNFREVSEIFLANQAAVQVEDEKELGQVLDRLLRSAEESSKLGRNALGVIKKNTGAVDRALEKIKKHITDEWEERRLG